MSIIIERAAASDAQALLDYLRQVGSETENLTFGSEGVPFTAEAEAEFLSAQAASTDNIMLLAKDNGQIVGCASLNRLPRRMKHRGDFAVSVRKSHWNQGIGSRLLEQIVQFAKNNHFRQIDLQVRSDNTAAIHLYEKYGFRKIYTYPGFFRMGGQDIDFEIMLLQIP